MCAPQAQRKSSQATIDRVSAWAAANPERRKAIALKSYLKYRPELNPVLTPFQRFESLYTPTPATGCWLWTGAVNRNGYGKIKVERKDLTAHRWSWILHKGEILPGLHVLHRCDVPGCVNPDHLFLGTNQDNVDDRETKGRGYEMPVQRNPKLTDDQVFEIRRLQGKETVVSLGKRFGVDHSSISRIHNRQTWKHL